MNINIIKISLVIIRDKEGKVIASIKPDMIGLTKMMDKTEQLIISEAKR